MRQRITFFHKPGEAVDPASLKITDTSLTGPEVNAGHEERITISLYELPDELRKVFTDSHELHVRWVSPEKYATFGPLLSRLSPGLHVFYTPQQDAARTT